MEEKEQRRRFWARGGFPAWAKMLVAVAVVLLFVLIFFRVRGFQVVGNVRYTAQEVADASGITEGDILMSINKTSTAGRLLVKLPYVEQVKIFKEMPGTVRFEIQECTAAFMAESEFSVRWLLSDSGKLLEEVEETDEEAESGYPVIVGTKLVLPVAGDMAAFDDSAKGTLAMELMDQVLTAGLGGTVTELDVSDLQNVVLRYGDRLEVNLGDGSDGAYKLKYLQTVLPELGETARGILDLSFGEGEQAVFHPIR